MFETARVRLGISPTTFSWTLEPGEVFATPEAVIAYSDGGLGAMSDAFHGLYRERLARGRWRDAARPILLNTWEAAYFDFDEAQLLEIATAARDLGIELFVLDDGWFGARDSDDSSLGDWDVDRRKLPGGIDGLDRAVEALGLSSNPGPSQAQRGAPARRRDEGVGSLPTTEEQRTRRGPQPTLPA